MSPGRAQRPAIEHAAAERPAVLNAQAIRSPQQATETKIRMVSKDNALSFMLCGMFGKVSAATAFPAFSTHIPASRTPNQSGTSAMRRVFFGMLFFSLTASGGALGGEVPAPASDPGASLQKPSLA
jgi:hypothetical protein